MVRGAAPEHFEEARKSLLLGDRIYGDTEHMNAWGLHRDIVTETA
jgi:hypothetical protein